MKLRLTFVCAGLIALAMPFVASAGSATDRVTGGGQILVGTGRGGALDTIAFTAQDRATNLGQVQFVDREGAGQTVYHGIVTCLDVMSNTMAKFAGAWRNGGTFQVLVTDNGQGAAAQNDIVTMENGAPNSCAQDSTDDDQEIQLARGNVQIYNAP